jgi:hypothetical protein
MLFICNFASEILDLYWTPDLTEATTYSYSGQQGVTSPNLVFVVTALVPSNQCTHYNEISPTW